jgi:hypothetical protein
METLKIVVNLPASVAILAQSREAGEAAWPLAGVLPLLSDETREWVASRWTEETHTPGVGRLRGRTGTFRHAVELTATPTDSVVAAAIEADRGEELTEAAAEAAEAEARVVRAVATPDADWLQPGTIGEHPTAPSVATNPNGIYLPDPLRSDRRIVARRVGVEARALPRAVGEWVAKQTAWQAEQDAKAAAKAAKEAAREAAAEALRAWAAQADGRIPNRIVRAAKDNMNVRAELIRELAVAVAAVCESAVGGNYPAVTDAHGETLPRDGVPSDEAYRRFDALTAAVPQIAQAAALPDAAVKIGPFVRVDINEGSERIYRAAVEVIVTADMVPGTDLGCYVLVEPPALDDDDCG